jgi:hypothetical protein
MKRSSLTPSQIALVAVVILLLLAIFSPASVMPLYTSLNLIVSVVSIAFYGLGALWFYQQLTKKE